MIKVATTFLKNQQELAKTSLSVKLMGWQPGKNKHEVICTPLHVASTPEMINLLIANGAEVNSLDENGLTPLDICLGAVGHLGRTGEESSPVRAYHAATLLISRDGRMTKRGKTATEPFARVFKVELEKELSTLVSSKVMRKPPMLKKRVFLGAWGKKTPHIKRSCRNMAYGGHFLS
jgi:hypothetical protein